MISPELARDYPSLERFLVKIPEAPLARGARIWAGVGPAVVLAVGVVLLMVDIPLVSSPVAGPHSGVRIRLQQILKTPPPKPDPIESVIPKEIPVLTPKTILSAPEEKPAQTLEDPPAPTPSKPDQVPAAAAPRRIYGVRKIYSRGIGKGSATAQGLVTKLGNTLDGRADTLTATKADLQGSLAALSTVDSAPEPRKRVKPTYSAAMLEARAQGTVTAHLLIDATGAVSQVKIIEDIGLDSKQVAIEALRGFQFKPAYKNGNPVAVWILHRIRFEYQE